MDYYFIGDPELATAFHFIGIQGTPALTAEEALAAFHQITGNQSLAGSGAVPAYDTFAETCRVLILTEETGDWLGDELIQWQLSGRFPLIVEIPGMMGRLPGRKTLVDAIREAVGVQV